MDLGEEVGPLRRAQAFRHEEALPDPDEAQHLEAMALQQAPPDGATKCGSAEVGRAYAHLQRFRQLP